jgi:hypothetical protein
MQPPVQSLIDSAQEQAEQNIANNPFNVTPSPGSTADQNQTYQQTPATQPTTGGPNLLERLLPTIGGVGGGLLAGGLDLVTGGAAIPFDAAIAGAGSALGKGAENLVTHQGLGNGVLSSGLEGAVGQGLGEGAGALLGKAGGVLGNVSKSMADSQAATASQAAQDAEDQAAVDEANATKNNFGGVKPSTQAANSLNDNQALFKSFGVDSTDPVALNHAAKGGLFIDNIDKEALSLGQPIKTTDLISSNDITKATPEEQQALSDSGIITPEGTMSNEVTPLQANQFAQSLNTQVRDAKILMDNAQANSPADYNALKQNYNSLNTLYKNVQNVASTPEVNEAVAARTITPAEKAQLVSQYGQKEADYIEDKVNSAQTHQDLVSAKLPFAQMDNVSKAAMRDLQATGTARNVARVKGAVKSQTNGNLLSPDNVVGAGSLFEGTLGHHPLALAAPIIMKALENPAVVGGAGRALTSLGGSAIPGAVGAIVGNTPNDVAGPAGQSNAIVNNVPNETNPFQTAIISALLNGNSGALNPLYKDEATLNAAQAAEQNLANNFNLAGGAQGPLGGILSRLGSSLTGGEASRYGSQAQADQQAIANAEQLMTGSNVSPQSISVPQITENQSAAQASLGNIQSLIQALLAGGVVPQQQ